MACINKIYVIHFIRVGQKHDLHRNCSYEWNSQVTSTERTELVSMWTAAVEIHANSCLLEPVYGRPTWTHVYVNAPLSSLIRQVAARLSARRFRSLAAFSFVLFGGC